MAHFLGFSLRITGRVFEPVTVIAGFDDIAVMRQSIKQCNRHLFITKKLRPCKFYRLQKWNNLLLGAAHPAQGKTADWWLAGW